MYRRTKKSNLQRQILLQAQMNVKLLICKNCNLRCDYCHNDYKGNVNPQTSNFSIETITQTLSKYNINNIENIKISGGEPFLKPEEVCKIMEYSSNINKKTVILTNATIHNSNLLQKIIEHKINEIRINIPSFDVSKYKNLTKANDNQIKVLYSNIDYLAKNNIPISLNVVLTCHINELENFITEYLTAAYKLMNFKSIRFIVNDWLPDKENYFDIAHKVIATLTGTSGKLRRGRIIDFRNHRIPVSLSKCNMDEEADIYLVPPGIVLTNHTKGRAYD